jgi:hypothetical protein
MLAVACVVMLSHGCSRQDAASVIAFGEQYVQVVELQERAIAASYPYQLAATPETRAVNDVFAKIRTRSASRSDFENALQAEHERGWYLDHFQGEVEKFRAAVAELRTRAAAINDGELRRIADDICRRFTATLDSTAGLLDAQRERSRHVVVFFTEILSRERRFPRLTDLQATGEQLDKLRETMIQAMKEPGAAFERFRSLVESKLGLQLSPRSVAPRGAGNSPV